MILGKPVRRIEIVFDLRLREFLGAAGDLLQHDGVPRQGGRLVRIGPFRQFRRDAQRSRSYGRGPPVEILPKLWASYDRGIAGGMYLHDIPYLAATNALEKDCASTAALALGPPLQPLTSS